MTMELRSSLTGIPVARLSCKETRHGEVPELTAAGLKQDPPATAGGSRLEYPAVEYWGEDLWPVILSHDWESTPFKEQDGESELGTYRWTIQYFRCRRCKHIYYKETDQTYPHCFCKPKFRYNRPVGIKPISCNEAMMRIVCGG